MGSAIKGQAFDSAILSQDLLSSFEQVTLPFGTPLNAESTGASNRRFTSYDRSVTTGLDYAVNRHYDSQQGRFTQVDPAGMKATTLLIPQTLNLYAYCTNDPVNRTGQAIGGQAFDSAILSQWWWIKDVLQGLSQVPSKSFGSDNNGAWRATIVAISVDAPVDPK